MAQDPWTAGYMQETLLADSTCRLFGRIFEGLTLGNLGPPDHRINTDRGDRALARIYGFSWQGTYFKLAVPTVMMVYGDGLPLAGNIDSSGLDEIGIEFKDEFFSQKVLMWTMFDTAFAVRIDITSGFLSEILIAPESSDASNVTGTGDGTTNGRGRVVGRANLAARGANLIGRPPNS